MVLSFNIFIYQKTKALTFKKNVEADTQLAIILEVWKQRAWHDFLFLVASLR